MPFFVLQESSVRKTGEGSDRSGVSKWQMQSESFRHRINISRQWNGWTSQKVFQGTDVPVTARVKDLINCAVAWHLRERELPFWVSPSLRMELSEVFIDVSQNLTRNPWTRVDGLTPCLTRSSCLYSLKRDSLVYPQELARFMGWPDDVEIPPSISSQKMKEMLANGIALPCQGALVLSWYLVFANASMTT